MAVSERIRALDTSGIRRMFDLAAKLEDPINLSIGQPHYDVPSEVKERMVDAIRQGENRYTATQGILPLRQEILKRYADRGIPQEEALITSGVSGGALLALIAMCDPGDEVLLPDPYFVFYKSLAQLFGITPKLVDTYPDFRWRREQIEPLITPKTRAIIVTSPANPTGVSATAEELAMIAGVARDHDLWVVYDEIYEQFSFDRPHLDMAALYEKTVTLGGFSKSHSMTGLRIGTAVGPKEILQEMIKLQQYTYVCAPSVAQWGALTALSSPMDEAVADYRRKRDYLFERLSPHYEIVRPDGAFYMFIKAPETMGGAAFTERALEHKMILVPGKVFSERDSHFRLSFAASDRTLERGVEALLKMRKSNG